MAVMANVKQRLKERAESSVTIDLRRRVRALEADVQECRALNMRLAELTDLVTELLVPLSQRDEDKVRELLARYQDSL